MSSPEIMQSVKRSLFSQINETIADPSSMHLLEVVIIIMSELEHLSYLSGEEKNKYCIDMVYSILPDVGHTEIHTVIDSVIKLTKGKTIINKHKSRLCCFK